MKRVVLLALAVTLCASVTAADQIALYNAPLGDPCVATPPAPYKVYVVHHQHGSEEGPTGSFWALDDFTGEAHSGYTSPAGMTPLGDPWLNGISQGYGDCKLGDFVILELNYAGQATHQPCGRLHVVGHRANVCPALPGQVCYTDCNFEELPAAGSTAIFNPNSTCGCQPAVESKTWGSVKALYR